MTPFGHASVSYVVGARWKRVVLPGLLAGGLLLDIDFLLLRSPTFNQIHRTATHNVFFVLLLALIGGLVARTSRRRVAFSILVGGLLHLLIDSVMDDKSHQWNRRGLVLASERVPLFAVQPHAAAARRRRLG